MLPYYVHRRAFHRSLIRRQNEQPTYQAPDVPKSEKPNAHRNFYRQFGKPVLKNFLIAVATYQVIYLTWGHLERMEIKREKESEMRSLESELQRLATKEHVVR
ncbi:hypothetical protein BAUCODRAFT_322645 [Baudoinia panamericana UAMH 10762]|uniref:Uncharacterized protein n=1 Tax=Baudoinia panamericana (strain UAMH 10762) TaxID=717646 RepID=M2MJ70_BAUPA|nr:uncharacterized protein BAUCODRAFT_322645 [Baudoinia panamericana UAMH 10762]EMC91323.1 hypothetical protein BAUCODRAFT_322645 [Baudoinia panamericana UAMH 10762]